MENCIFPQLPVPNIGQPGSYDTRRFKVGEPVCLRNQPAGIVTGTYLRPRPQPGTGNVYGHTIISHVQGVGPSERAVEWEHVGKIAQPMSATAANFVSREKGLPANIASIIKKYGGKRRRTLRKKLKSRSRSRRN